MKIAMICPYDIAVPGGVKEQVLGLATGLRERGHLVEIIAPGRLDGANDDSVTGVGHSIPLQVNGSIARLAPQPTAWLRTFWRIRHGGFDVVHVHEPFAPSIGIPAVLGAEVPVVATFHAAGQCAAYRWFRRPLELVARHIDVRIAVSPAAAAFAGEHIDGDYSVLFNGVDVDRYRRGRVSRLPNPSVLFIGRHETRKGLGVLLEAIRMTDTPLDLYIGGEGPDTDYLRHRYAHDRRVHWLGCLSDARKIQWMRMVSLVCVPSIGGESFGVVPLEAMAAHTPVVMSDIPAYRRVSDNGLAALLVPPGDHFALERAISDVVLRRVDSESLVARADQVADRCSFTRLVDAYLDIYSSLMPLEKVHLAPNSASSES